MYMYMLYTLNRYSQYDAISRRNSPDSLDNEVMFYISRVESLWDVIMKQTVEWSDMFSVFKVFFPQLSDFVVGV